MNIRIWIDAFRPRTLPLALASVFLGSFLAYANGCFHLVIFIFASLTTLFLQILSNLANDYGDFMSGVDNNKRIGPVRGMHNGKISPSGMMFMIRLYVVLSLISGLILIFVSLHHAGIVKIVVFFVIGLMAIIAAVKYTVGTNPYGYSGLGDFFVFFFFGIVGVQGTYFLYSNTLSFWILMPSAAIGLFSTAVLNLNNMRDAENDFISGKNTVVVHIGWKAAKIYHILLIILAFALSILYTLKFSTSVYQFLFLVTIPLFTIHLRNVIRNKKPEALNKELMILALSTFIFSITFGIGMILK